jgi:hypothetical protein
MNARSGTRERGTRKIMFSLLNFLGYGTIFADVHALSTRRIIRVQ